MVKRKDLAFTLGLLLISVTSLITIISGCVKTEPTAPSPAAFSVTNLRIEPSEVKVGEKTTVSAEVQNTGGIEGSYSAELKVNGLNETSQNVTIPAGASSGITFTVSKDTPGVYQVTLDNLTGQFTVTEAPVSATRTITWSDSVVTQLLLGEMSEYSVHILSNNKAVVEGGPIGITVTIGVSDVKIYFGVPSMAYDYLAGGQDVIKTYTEYDGEKLWLTALPPWVDPSKEIAPDVNKLPFVESVTTKGGEATLTYRWP